MEFKRCFGCMRALETRGGVCPVCGYDNTKGPLSQPGHVLPCGTILNGQYVVGRSLGQGGFGVTYIGFDLNLELPVCIKEYFPEGAAMRSSTLSHQVFWGTSENAQSLKNSRESFVREARKAVKLRDLSHVVSVWGVFYENETAYIVMDYIEGETLKSRLVRTGRTLGERECVELLAPIMRDLGEAHARGIIHRDIKPDNIMLTPKGKPMLLDMGAAKDLGQAGQNGGAPTSTLVVSHGFSPLEQYREHGDIGPWTDVYALCATMVWCASGKLLPAPLERMIEDRPDLSAFSPMTAAVLKRGLALRHEDRIQSMEELRAALDQAENRNEELTERDYLAAKSQMARGNKLSLIAAESMFKALGDYKDAAEQAEACRRLQAEQAGPEKREEAAPEPRREKTDAKPGKEKKARRRLRLPWPAWKLAALLIGALLLVSGQTVEIFYSLFPKAYKALCTALFSRSYWVGYELSHCYLYLGFLAAGAVGAVTAFRTGKLGYRKPVRAAIFAAVPAAGEIVCAVAALIRQGLYFKTYRSSYHPLRQTLIIVSVFVLADGLFGCLSRRLVREDSALNRKSTVVFSVLLIVSAGLLLAAGLMS